MMEIEQEDSPLRKENVLSAQGVCLPVRKKERETNRGKRFLVIYWQVDIWRKKKTESEKVSISWENGKREDEEKKL